MIDKNKQEVYNSPIRHAILFLLIALICISFPLNWFSKWMDNLVSGQILRFIFSIIGIFLMLLYGFKNALKPTKDILKNFDIIICGLIIAINNFPIIGLVTNKASIIGDTPQIVSFVFFCFSVGFFEEIFFRGLIMSALSIYFKKYKHVDFLTVVISSALFGLVHILNIFSNNAGAVFLQVGYTFLNGMVFALLFYFTKSIYFSILCHTLFDIGGLMIGTIGKGEIWNTPTVILTAVLSTLVAIYLSLRFFFKIKANKKDDTNKDNMDNIDMFKIEGIDNSE